LATRQTTGKSANGTLAHPDEASRTVSGQPAKTGVDSAAISRELDDLLDQTADTTQSAAVRQRQNAIRIYNNHAVPAALRGDAASLVSVTYQNRHQADEACQWIANALVARPGWNSYKSIQQRLACK